ncbi:MAG: hypothetical protein M1608_17320 [Candidatus Omnitrophica bacterium]|nr:hypothetical protein [Candidatus Omnitrophota bacterium]
MQITSLISELVSRGKRSMFQAIVILPFWIGAVFASPAEEPALRTEANVAGFPWTTNYGRICPEYFDAADARLGYLVEQGFTP